MKHKLLAIALLLVSYANITYAQKKCGFDDWVRDHEVNHPGYKNAIDADIQEMVNTNNERGGDFVGKLYTIRVVFHNVYNTNAQNVSLLRFQNQIKAMNRDYSAANPDWNNIRTQFLPYSSGDSRIRFELATTKPNGDPTTGIEWLQTSIPTFYSAIGGEGLADNVKRATTGGLDAWDPSRYLNIWVCNFSNPTANGEVVGYATPPPNLQPYWDNSNSDPSLQGVVLSPSVVGDNIPASQGRTAVHEVGHYLGLRHVWGDAQPACGEDYIWDTPPAGDQLLGWAACNGKSTIIRKFRILPVGTTSPQYPAFYAYDTTKTFTLNYNTTTFKNDTVWKNQVRIDKFDNAENATTVPDADSTGYYFVYPTNFTYYIKDTITIRNEGFAAQDSGAYELVISNPLGCSDTLHFNVIKDAVLPSVLNIPNPTPSCNPTTIDAGLFAGSTTYVWKNKKNAVIGNSQTLTLSQSTDSIRVTITNLCGNVISNYIDVVCLGPNLTLNQSYNSCAGTNLKLKNGKQIPNSTVVWTNNLGTVLATDIDSIIVTTSDTYKVKVTTPGGCVDSISTVVNFTNALVAPVLTTPAASCYSTTLDAGTQPAGTTFKWVNKRNVVLGTSQTLTLTKSDSAKVTLSNVCGNVTSNFVYVVISRPKAVLNSNYRACGTSTPITIQGNQTGNNTISWLKNGVLIAGANSNSYSVPTNQPGTYQLILTSSAGCSDTATTIVSFDTPVTAVAPPTPTPSCSPITLNAGNYPLGTMFKWLKAADRVAGYGDSYVVSRPGTFKLVAYNACGTSTSAGVYVNSQPLPTPTVDSVYYKCQNQISIAAGSHFPNVAYTWTHNGNVIQGTNSITKVPVVVDSVFVSADDTIFNQTFTKTLFPNTCKQPSFQNGIFDLIHYLGDLPDFLEDYMFYTDEVCTVTFSKAQVELMQNVLSSRRPGIATISINGIVEGTGSYKLKFAPNPASDFITINDVPANSVYQITSVSGSVIAEGKLDSKIIDLTNISNGVYTIRVTSKNDVFVNKVVISK